MMLYILNTAIIPINWEQYNIVTVHLRRITPEEAREMLQTKQFVSAVGHEGTALILSQLLGVNIPFNRAAVYMQPGDEGLHFVLRVRLPEGKVLSAEELAALDYWLVYSKII